jgi:predicted hydrolase (HD superfamily)
MKWNEEEQKWEFDGSRRDFDYIMRKQLRPEVRALLEVATEVYCKLGPADVSPTARKYSHTFERLRSALLAMEREGFVAYEWTLPERASLERSGE